MSKTAHVTAALVLAGTSLVLAQRVDVSRTDSPEVLLKTAINLELVDGQPNTAIQRYREIAARYKTTNRRVAAQALLHAARSYERIASSESRVLYAELLRDFADQPEAAEARARLGTVRGARTQMEISPRRVLEGSSIEMMAVVDDGRLVVGREIVGINYSNLIVRDLSSGRTTTLLRGTPSAFWFRPLPSKDGRRVAYRWRDVAGGREPQVSLRVVGTEPGAAPEIILPQISPTTNPMGWSLDGKALLVSTTPQELAWVSVESKAVQTVKTFDAWREVYDATVSPDGRFIAFSAKPVASSNDKYIYIMDANGQRERAVVKSAGSRAWPFWRPDGAQLLFRGDRDTPGGSALWSIGVRDGEAVGEPWIVKDGFTDTPIGMTSSGSLFYTRSTGGMPHQFLIHRNPAQGESAQTFMGMAASWSPDGRSLAFLRGNAATGELELIIRSVDTGEERSYRRGGIPRVSPRWLHDGSGVIVGINAQVDGRQTSAFYFVDASTGIFRRLFDKDANGRQRTMNAAVSPDDKTLYLGARNGPGGDITGIVGVDLATGVERPILALPGAVSGGTGLDVSPDGSTLAVMALMTTATPSGGEARIFTVGVDGANYREVFGPIASGAGGLIADKMRWTPDGRTIVFVAFDAHRNWRLMRVPAENGKAEFDGLDFDTLAARIAGLRMVPGSLWNLDLSPDGSRALVSTSTLSTNELWVLDNLPSVNNSR